MKLQNKDSYILVLNAGSATLKWALYEKVGLIEIGRGTVERIGDKDSFVEWRLFGKLTIKKFNFTNHQQAVVYILKILAWHKILNTIVLVGHRIVHGGELFIKTTKLNSKVIKKLEKLPNLAPLHNPTQLAVAKAAHKLLNKVPHSAVFDTAWFAKLPVESQVYALPLAINKKFGFKKYGFHGLSHSFVTKETARILNKKPKQLNLVTCHLGSGSSVTAVKAGIPIDTSMGFTPLAGLVMCTRAGDVDPGLIMYLSKQKGYSVKKLDSILNHESGLKGLTGVADMREVLVRAGYTVPGFRPKKSFSANDKKQAKLALKVYLHSLQKYIGAYAAILGRVDAVVFTGGIGERNKIIRNLAMQGLPGLKNITILAIPTNEELAIAREIINY